MTLEEAIKKATDAGDEVTFLCKGFQQENMKGVVAIRFWSEGCPPNMTIFESYKRFIEVVDKIYESEESQSAYTASFYTK
jgi:hypothetical protein